MGLLGDECRVMRLGWDWKAVGSREFGVGSFGEGFLRG